MVADVWDTSKIASTIGSRVLGSSKEEAVFNITEILKEKCLLLNAGEL